MENYVKLYHQQHTVADLVNHTPLPMPDYIFFKKKIRGHEKETLPKISHTKDSLQFDMGGTIATLTVLSIEAQRYSLNGKILDLSATKNPLERWRLFEKALPSYNTSRLDWILPQAHANLIAILGLLLGLAGFAAGTSSSWVAVRGGNQNICRELKMALGQCAVQLGKVTKFVRKRAQGAVNRAKGLAPIAEVPQSSTEVSGKNADALNWEMLQAAVKRGECPTASPDDKLDEETSKVANEVLQTYAVKKPVVSGYLFLDDCENGQKDRAAVDTCIENIGTTAKGICFTLTVDMIEGITGNKFQGADPAVSEKGQVPSTNPTEPAPPPIAPISIEVPVDTPPAKAAK
ncbi:MAG: hypothetical protein ACXVA9_05050 [Bdellovibrionales bacterium]